MPLRPASPQTNTFSICLNHGITLAPGSPGTAGFTKATARTGAVTLIQCFGGTLNAHIHFHMLFLDGLYADNKHGTSGFCRLKAPTNDELIQLTHTIAHRVGRYLARQGLLVRDSDQSYLAADAVEKVRPGTGREAGLGHADNETPMNHLLGSSITYRIAMGPQQGRKVISTFKLLV